MERKESWKFSEICFRVCATCVVLAITAGIGSCASSSSEAKSVAGLLLVGGALALVAGIVAAIWDQ